MARQRAVLANTNPDPVPESDPQGPVEWMGEIDEKARGRQLVVGSTGPSMVLVEGMEDVGTAKTAMPAIWRLAGEPINRADAERLAGVLKALADPARLRLVSLIQSAPHGEASVSDLTAPLGLSQPTVSHHLRILTEAGLLERDKRGVFAYYRLVPSAIATIGDLLTPPRKRATKNAAR